MKLILPCAVVLVLTITGAFMSERLKPHPMYSAQLLVADGVTARIELTMPWPTYLAWMRGGTELLIPAPPMEAAQ